MIHRLTAAFVALLFLVSCNKQAEVSIMNLSEVDRQDELVELCVCQFKKLDPAKIVVLDSTGKPLPVQLLYKGETKPQSFVFPVSVKAGRKVVVTVQEGVPEKSTDKMFVGHVSEGNWMEQALGTNVIAPYSEDSIWSVSHYDRFRILDKGALRSSFVFYYDSVRYDSHVLSAEVQVTLDAGSQLNEITVRFSGDTAQLRLVAGITITDPSYVLNGNPERGFIGFASPASLGRGYIGMVFLTRLAEVKVVDGSVACISHYMQGEFFRYFAGAARSTNGFTSDQEWFNYLSNQYKAKSNPLDIRIDR